MKKLLIEMVGWYGTIAIVGAYALNSFSVIQANTLLYQLLNMTGAIGIVIVSFSKKSYQPGVLNSIWTIIAAVAIIKMFMGM